MTQNIVSIAWTDAELAEVDQALTTLETRLANLAALSPAQVRGLAKMGDKSEAFCRQTLNVLASNQQVLPPNFSLPEAIADLTALDKLRPRLARLQRLTDRADDTTIALGSDLMAASLEGYALLRVSGKNQGLETLRRDLSARFRKSASNDGEETPPPAKA